MCRKRKILQSNGSRQQTRKKSKIKPKDDRVREKVNSKLRDYVKLFGPEWALISQLLNLDFQKQLNLELDRKNLCNPSTTVVQRIIHLDAQVNITTELWIRQYNAALCLLMRARRCFGLLEPMGESGGKSPNISKYLTGNVGMNTII